MKAYHGYVILTSESSPIRGRTAGEPMTYKSAEAVGWAKDSVYKFASDLAEILNIQPGAPLDRLIGDFGGQVIYQNIFEAESTNHGSIQIDAKNSFKIYVPDYVSRERNRFTIAHEIGHYFLHFLVKNKGAGKMQAERIPSKDSSERTEWEANWFAAGFLMPEKHFLPMAKEAKVGPVDLSRHFGVSLEAVKIHLGYHNDRIKA